MMGPQTRTGRRGRRPQGGDYRATETEITMGKKTGIAKQQTNVQLQQGPGHGPTCCS